MNFSSIRARLMLLCICLVLLTACTLMWFAHTGTVSALRSVERRSLDNILFLVERDMGITWQRALKAQATMVNEYKMWLRFEAEVFATGSLRAGQDDTVVESEAEVLEEISEAYKDARARGFSVALCNIKNGTILYDNKRYDGTAFVDALKTMPAEGGFFYLSGAFAQKQHTLGQLFSPFPSNIVATSQQRRPPWQWDIALPEYKKTGAICYTVLHGDWVTIGMTSADSLQATIVAEQETIHENLLSLVNSISIQQTGFVAVLNSTGELVAGSAQADISDALVTEILDNAGAPYPPRRLLLLPEKHGDVLYTMAYFRPLQMHIIVAAPVDELEGPAFVLMENQLLITLLVVCVAGFWGLFFSKRLAAPIRLLAQQVVQLPEKNITTLNLSSLKEKLPLNSYGEIGELSRSFLYMSQELQTSVLQLIDAATLQERLNGELQFARDIQYGILPAPMIGGGRGELAALLETAKEVGGDLYDYFKLDNDRFCLIVGDVSDKGIPAALFMSMTVTLVRSAMQNDGLPPDEALKRINNTLARHNPRNMFVTLCIIILDLTSGRFTWASGGHPPAIRLSPCGATTLPATEDMVVGVFEGIEYKLMHDTLQPGETLFVYSDGVSEAMNSQGELFGDERLLGALASVSQEAPQKIINFILATVQSHEAGTDQSDDITMLALRYKAQ